MKGCRLRNENHQEDDLIDDVISSDSDIEDENMCIVCFENKKDTVFYKCGHLACCNACAILMRDKNAECPICRAQIIDVTKIYQV